MSDHHDDETRRLREEAERQLAASTPHALPDTTEALRHELSVHEIELELQNERLREANVELRAARDRYEELYEYAPVGYLTLDERGEIRSVNRRATDLLGQDRERLLGRRLTQFVAAESRTTFALLLPRLHASEAGAAGELRLERPDGRALPVRLEGRAHPTGGTLVALTDISTEHEAREALLKLNETLEGQVEERTRKIRELGDELRTVALAVAEDLMAPLRRVGGFVEVLRREDALGDTRVEHFQHVFRSVNRMEELTTALLDYTRASQMRVRVAPLDLNRVLTEVRKDLRPLIGERAVHVTSAKLPVVQGDSTAMQLVFLKILENAVKFTATREEARVHVSAEESATEVVVRFEDNGVGFNNRHKDRLFGVFKRLHSESAFHGTGIGLAIVRRVVLRFGGRVWAEGRVGEGATFFVAWPKQPVVLE
ncbi:sensor histidine kinase [Deinococcus pimensis]|uniref:sensor histidine kinase n=1 Tax=Deinococcus pimensis TaxID=309888 RepID=UPI0004B68752|nr:ATP-binding protein [Deinococcus pimensis]